VKNKRHYFFILSGAIIILFACFGFRIDYLFFAGIFSVNPEPELPITYQAIPLVFLLVGMGTFFRNFLACALAVLMACFGSFLAGDQLSTLSKFGGINCPDGKFFCIMLASLLFVAVSLISQVKQWRWPSKVFVVTPSGFLALMLGVMIILCACYLASQNPIPAPMQQVRTFTQDGVQFQVSGPAIVQVGQPVAMTIRLTNNRAEPIQWHVPEDRKIEIREGLEKSYFRGFYKKAVPKTEFGKAYQSPWPFYDGRLWGSLPPGQSKEWHLDFNQLVILDRGFYLASFSFDGGVMISGGSIPVFVNPCGIDHIGLEVR
jgi:hypothetical protein